MAQVSNSTLLNTAGILHLEDACIVLVKTEWNHSIVDELERGCVEAIRQNGVVNIRSITVPGAVEIPFAVKAYWEKSDTKPDAFITLGCVIKGDTPHFEYVCKTATDGVLQLNLSLPIPVIFGILTVNTQEQAQERIGGKHGHKGEEAGITALKMIAFNRSINK